MSTLPDCDEVFERFFLRWYEPDDLKHRGCSTALPDVVEYPDWAKKSAEELCVLTPELRKGVEQHITPKMAEAVEKDFQRYLKVELPVSIEWIDEFDRHWDRQRIANLLDESDPSDFCNSFLVNCCEFGVAMGRVMIQHEPRLVWLYDMPYWDSSIWDQRTGKNFNVFHWAVKKHSEYGVDDGFLAKIDFALHLLRTSSR